MLEKDQIFEVLKEKSVVREYEMSTRFITTSDEGAINKQVFASMFRPLPEKLCFWAPEEDGTHRYMTLFDIKRTEKMTVYPFGGGADSPQDGKGMSYNVFHGSLPVQSYTVTMQNNRDVPRRKSKQSHYFKETEVDGWSAGHLIAHEDSPQHFDLSKRSTLQIVENFIPEPHYWNCYQRSHLEKKYRSEDGVYAVYPMYTMWHTHRRTVGEYKGIGDRKIPDGVFFAGKTNNGYKSTDIYVPFLSDNGGIFTTEVANKGTFSTKLEKMVNQHKIGAGSRPKTLIWDLDESKRYALLAKLERQRKSSLTKARHHAASDQQDPVSDQIAMVHYERSATMEFESPENKMQAAVMFSRLGDRKMQSLYTRAVASHAKTLRDDCDGDEKVKISNSVFKNFKELSDEIEDALELVKRIKHKNS